MGTFLNKIPCSLNNLPDGLRTDNLTLSWLISNDTESVINASALILIAHMLLAHHNSL